MNFDSYETPSSREQRKLEQTVARTQARVPDVAEQLQLDRSQHINYLQNGLKNLPAGFVSLEAARPWILYWITHSLALLKVSLPAGVSNAG